MKIALIYSHTPSEWVSCQSIVQNLASAYHLLDDRYDIIDINYSKDQTDYELTLEFEKIKVHQPDKLVFIDHLPHPLNFLKKYVLLIDSKIPSCTFHVFGDFTLNLMNWKKTQEILDLSKSLFVCASEKQTKMINELIRGSSIVTIPFPVKKDKFYFSQKSRTEKRLKHRWNESKVLLYTGRLSRQKNILELIKQFSSFIDKNESTTNMRLIFVGEFDEVGEPYRDRTEWKEEYFHEVNNFYNSLSVKAKASIEIHPFKKSEELYQWYSASDFFVNLSTHNDEDFGMSCAESLMCGLRMILTDWAGFSSFSFDGNSNYVQYVDVSLEKNEKKINFNQFNSILDSIRDTELEPVDTKSIQKSIKQFSIESISKKIELSLSNINDPMKTTNFLNRLAGLENNFYNEVFYDTRNRCYRDTYYQLYKHYASTNEH